jgi:RHS repeat-associated protein
MALVSRYAYDPMGRLIQHQAGLRGNAALLGRRYGYDATGKLNAVDDLRQGASRYLYDPADRLLQVEGLTPERFVHDPAGNLIGMNEDRGGLVEGDRLVLLGDRHFSYDAAGNLSEERRGKAGRLVSRYAYDSDNRLIRAETPDGVSQYRYDPLGRRIAKVTPEGETHFVYDGARLLQETRAERCRTYLFEPGSFRPLACIDRQGSGAESAVYYYHLDHLGTPRELTDAAGKIVWSARYRAYGSLALADVDEIDNPLRFQGQYFDAETGLHYNLNRYYDPQAGRFIHQDPIGLAGGVNLFQYAVNPVNWIDPLGLTCSEVPGSTVASTRQSGFVFRGDGRSPDEIFEQGFQPLGTNQDLLKYTQQNEPSVFVSTSKSPNVAREFVNMQGDGFVYTIRGQTEGIDVNAVLGAKSPFPYELEIAVPGGVKPIDIMGARQVGSYGRFIGPFIKNPAYGYR